MKFPNNAARLDYLAKQELGEAPTWDTIEGKPAVLAEGQTQEEARSAIGAGTSDLSLGSTSSEAAPGNHDHAIAADVASGLASAADLQSAFIALSIRIKALEDATP